MRKYLQPALCIVLFAFAFLADMLMPGTGAGVVQANAGGWIIIGVIVAGGFICALRGNGSSDPICRVDDPKRNEKIRKFFERNNDRN